MPEALNAYVVPSYWYEKHVKVEPYQMVVGLRRPDGSDVLLPDSPRDYRYGGGYSCGYSKTDIREHSLPLEPEASAKLVSFFDDFLIKLRWRDMGILAERYDCHWLASWLTSQIDGESTTTETLDIADSIVMNGIRTELPLEAAKVGVIGGLCVASKLPAYAEAYHSFVSIGNGDALQAAGMHGAVAIASQADTFTYFQETTDLIPRFANTGLDVFTNTDTL